MKVLMPNHFPLQGSGSGIYTLNVAQELVKAGHEVLAIVPDHQPTTGYSFPVETILFSNGANEQAKLNFNFPCFTTHPRSTTTFYELSDDQIKAYVDAWQEAMEQAIIQFQPDIIHAHHVWVTPFVAQQFDLPYVISCHGTDLMGFRRGPRYREMALTGAQHAYAIIAISRQVKADALATYQVPSEQVPLIWNGFDDQRFRVIPEAIKENVLPEYGIQVTNRPLVSFVGKFTDFKGIDVLLKAAAIYEQAVLGVQTVLVGHGQLWDEMHALGRELNLRGVHFLGHKPQTEVARIYNAADVSIVPSRIEPFGLVAVEALACGTPVVATEAGGLPDFINEEVGALVPLEDPEALATAIIAELHQGSKYTKGKVAAQYAIENFTWTRQVGKMIALYEEALAT
jgi:glycosyltransferase involved in cell wall biosynthesis